MEYIVQRKVIHPVQGVLKEMNHPISVTRTRPLKRECRHRPKIKLHDIHIKEWVSPPIMETKRKRNIIRR